MTIKRLVTAIALALLMGTILPVASAQAPPCFTFDGQIKTIRCPVSFRPSPVQYYSGVQSGFTQATDDNDRLPMGFFDQRTIETLRQNAAQNQSQNATQQPQPEPPAIIIDATTPGDNQTASPAATNLTTSDIEPVRDSLNTVRQSLERDDIQAAIESINRADGALFAIILEEGKGPVSEGLNKLSHELEITRESVFNLDNQKALIDLNAADSQLLLITEMLPTPPSTAPATAPATEEPQPQQSTNETLIFPERPANQSETLPAILEPQPAPAIQALEPEPVEQQHQPIIKIKIPLNQTQQELITVEEIGGLNKTTHEKTTITILQGNKTTHREVTTTEVPL